jgi:hypothetical protein
MGDRILECIITSTRRMARGPVAITTWQTIRNSGRPGRPEGSRMGTLSRRFTAARPLLVAALIVALGAGGGFGVAASSEQKLREILQTASTALIFGALLGGVVKLLLDQVERGRERRDEQLRFITALLADLKSVYDRVERARILVKAHRSAKTYGNEMRDLIESAVQLRNVKRALDVTSGLAQLKDVFRCIQRMEKYLNDLIEEFTTFYKRIADKQKVSEAEFTAGAKAYEASFAAQAKEATTVPNAILALPDDDAWDEILLSLPNLKEFCYGDPGQGYGGNDYQSRFVAALDLASWVLRNELQSIRGVRRSNITKNLEQVPTSIREQKVSKK